MAHIVVVSGCYSPSLRDCTIQCSGASQCAGDQICLADGYCASPSIARCDEGQPILVDAGPDAPGDPDASPDANDLCALGCTRGTCIGGVCTIDCSGVDSCENDVACPANLPCHVICGDSSCGGKINCTMASSCRVECIGSYACDDDIQCPADRECDVTCSGDNSCLHRTKCSTSCGCDVTCSGLGSCKEASECPASTCRIGNGCTSTLVGCDTCP